MKMILITFFAATSALLAAETNSPAPTLLTNAVAISQVDFVEQARLVAEIGQEAAKGFDAETHAHGLRKQIEALLTAPATVEPSEPSAPADTAESTTPVVELTTKAPAVTTPATVATPTSTTKADSVALQEAVFVLRRAANELEARIEKLARKP